MVQSRVELERRTGLGESFCFLFKSVFPSFQISVVQFALQTLFFFRTENLMTRETELVGEVMSNDEQKTIFERIKKQKSSDDDKEKNNKE